MFHWSSCVWVWRGQRSKWRCSLTWLLCGIPYRASTRSAARFSSTSWKKTKKGGLTENTTQGRQKKNQQEAIFSHTHIFHSAHRRGSVQSESLGLIMWLINKWIQTQEEGVMGKKKRKGRKEPKKRNKIRNEKRRQEKERNTGWKKGRKNYKRKEIRDKGKEIKQNEGNIREN